MIKVSRQVVEAICTQQGRFVIPDNIQRAIETSIYNPIDVVAEEYGQLLEKYKYYRERLIPAKLDYHSELTLDAYVVYYLSRNIIIPWIALRDLALHPHFKLPSRLKVLDLGSGTGAIPLGLLHLFQQKPFSSVAVSIVAIDSHKEALARQMTLIKNAGFPTQRVTTTEEDLSETQLCIPKIKALGPFNLIFVANCITELDRDSSNTLLSMFSEILADGGAVVIAEAQRDYVKGRIASLARKAEVSSLFVYYPCPSFRCNGDGGCWVWRDHQYVFPDLRINGEPLSEKPRERLTLSWLILTKQKVSLYDVFREKNESLTWGPIAREKSWDSEKERMVIDYGACDGNHVIAFDTDFNISLDYNRGSVVGLSSDGTLGSYVDLQ